MKDYNSIINQKIKEKFVQREVLTCFSYEMQDVLDKEIINYEDIENLYEYKCPNCGEGFPNIGDFGQETENKNEFHCPACDAHFSQEPENEPQEIFEWWIVTGFLAEKLKEQGQPVVEWGNNCYWGRCTTGQSILLDHVISVICEGMGILEGQENSWEKSI